MRRHTAASLILVTAAAFAGCAEATFPVAEGTVEVRLESDGARILNGTDGPIFFNIYRTGALALFRICTDPETCRSVPAASSRLVPFDEVTAWGESAASVTLQFWHLLPSDGGYQASEVRTVVDTR